MKPGAFRVLDGARFIALFICLIAAGLLSGCAVPQSDGLIRGERQGLPARAEVPAVPFFAQEDYYCGPAALAMTLAWSGLGVTQRELVPIVYTPGRAGTLQSDLVSGARRFGRLAVPVDSVRDLLSELAAGNPVLVFQNLAFDWFPQWHYAVAVGYDLDNGTITLHSGTHERLLTSLATFERTWARTGYWALVITPPGRLPHTGSEMPVIEAAAGIERAGRRDEAERAFEAIVARWPESRIAFLALGNVRFANADYRRAEQAYLKAGALSPDNGAVWNNLAMAIARQGRIDEALAYADKAVALGDRHEGHYRETVAEIRAMR